MDDAYSKVPVVPAVQRLWLVAGGGDGALHAVRRSGLVMVTSEREQGSNGAERRRLGPAE
jgi:hypothetical protein